MTELLAYVHPVVQALVLLMALATLRLGLALKNHRTGQRHLLQWQGVYNRHTQLGLVFVGCLIGGYLLGLLSMPLFRQRPPFRSAHFFFPKPVWADLRREGRIVPHPVFPDREGPGARRILPRPSPSTCAPAGSWPASAAAWSTARARWAIDRSSIRPSNRR